MNEVIETDRAAAAPVSQLRPNARAFLTPAFLELPHWLAKAFAALSPLWLAGVAVVALGLSLLPAIFLISRGSRLGIWIPYLVLGTVVPAVVTLILLAWRLGRPLPVAVQRLLIVLALVAPVAVAQPGHVLPALGLASLQTAICLGILRRCTLSLAVALMAVNTGTWLVMLKLFTWGPMPSIFTTSWPLLIIGGVSLVGCSWWAFTSGSIGDRFHLPADALAVGILILLAFRTDGLFQTDRVAPTGSFYHWGATVGPVEAVRQGGVLLWDTPSPYGFLLPLTVAALPTPTAWQSLYLLNAIASAILAVGIYLALRWRIPGIKSALLSLLLSAAVVFLASMYPPLVLPEHYFPMGGAFRYAWCYLLIGILLLERCSSRDQKSRNLILVAGSICWGLSIFWSPESAFFGTMIWIPAYIVIVLREHLPAQKHLKAIAGWVLLPMALLAVGVGCLFAVYQTRHGHGPDAQSYFEVVLSFGGSQVGKTSGLFGATDFADTSLVMVLGVVMFALAAGMLTIFSVWGDLPLALGLLFGTWALLAYPLSQPFLFASYRLLPFLVLGMAMILTWTAHSDVLHRTRWASVLRSMTIPVFTTLLVSAYANLPEFAYYASAIRNERFRGRDVTTGLPSVEPSLQQLLNAADVQPTDLLFYEGTTYGEMLPVWQPSGAPQETVSQQWLAGPLSSMIYLSDDRKQTYLARASERQAKGGWLIEPRNRELIQFSLGPWFFEQVNRTHIPAKFASNDEWQLIWFEPRVNDPEETSQLQDFSWVPEVTEDIRINGEKLTSAVLPPVWGVWGAEWIRSADHSGWCVPHEGTFGLFSTSPRRVTLKVKRTELSPGPLAIRVNDNLQVAAARPGSNPNDFDTVPLAIEAGWNTISLALADQVANEINGSVTAESCVSGTFPDGVLRIDRIDIRTK